MLLKAIIVEDDPMVSSINQRYLQKIDSMQCVGVAKSGVEAMELITKLAPDVVILDIYMPTMNGLELLREIRRLLIKIDVILVTAADNPLVIEESMRLGVVDYVIKPFDFERFRSALESFKKRYAMFRTQENLDQQALDSLYVKSIKSSAAASDSEFPKGIDPITLQIIWEAFTHADRALSAQEIADQTHLSRITTRKYMEYLCETDEIILDLKYSAKGRPTKLYSQRE